MWPQASFLLWLDFRGLGMCQKEIMNLLLDKAHLALNDGTMFGSQERFRTPECGHPALCAA